MSTHTASLATSRAPEVEARRDIWDYVRESGLRVLVLGPSKDLNAKITMLLVSPESGQPLLALKVPTTQLAERAVEAEIRVLRELEGHHLLGVDGIVPRVVDVVEFEGRTALVMTAVPGTPMTTSYLEWRHTRSPARVAADFAAVGEWLADFQRSTMREAKPLDMDAGVTSRLRSRFSGEQELDSDLERLTRIHRRLGHSRTPRTFVHGDLWCGNLLLDGGRVTGAVDWEYGSTCGEPVRDLVRFPLMYALYLDRRTRPGRRVAGHTGFVADSWGAGVAYALDGRGWFPELLRRFLQDGLARLGAAPECWRDAALAGIAEAAALTDDDEFARCNLALFQRLSRIEDPR
jgi:aminoglycoside phosphotransferase (APT) family kinase protein